jgi:MFS family permease
MVNAPEGTAAGTRAESADAARGEGRNRLILVALSFCILVPFMDLSIVSVALTAIGQDLHASTAQLQWVLVGYMIASAVFMLVVPAIGDRLGYRRVLLAGLVFFGIASVLGFLGRNPDFLITTRILMGIGSATVLPMIMSAIAQLFPDRAQRAAAVGTAVTIVGILNAAGPIVGGLLIDGLSWSWIFFINILMIATVVPLTVWLIPESKSGSPEVIDVASVVLLGAGLTCVIYGSIQIPENALAAAVLLTAGVATLAGFTRRQQHAAAPLVPLQVFSSPRYLWAQLTLAGGSFGIYAMLFAMAMYLQEVLRVSATEVGLGLVPAAASAALGTKIGRELSKRVDARWTVALGLAVFVLGLAMALGLSARSGIAFVIVMFTLTFTGGSIPQAPALAVATAELPPGFPAERAAFINSFRHIGGAFGVAVMGTVEALAYRISLPPGAPAAVRDSVTGIAYLPAAGGAHRAVAEALTHGVKVSMGCTAAVLAAVALLAVCLPHRNRVKST